MRGHCVTTWLVSTLLSINSANACVYDHLTARELNEISSRPVAIEARNVARPEHNKIAIHNVRVFDGNQLGKPSTVLINGEKIASITERGAAYDCCGADDVDGLGGVLLPGLIDSHAHPTSLGDLGTFSSYGVTTVLGMACAPEPGCNTLRNQVGLTDFYSAGVAATSPNSTHAALLGSSIAPSDLISSPDQAHQFVANRVGNGSDYIKLIGEANGMTGAEHNALVIQAHNFGKLATTHASTFYAWIQAVESKTDSIQHICYDKVLTQDVIDAVLQNKQVDTPTLTVIRTLTSSRYHAPNATYENARNSTTAIHQAGVPIFAGTDANNVGANLGLGVAFGSSLHDELENLVEAGLSTLEVLRAATSAPAQFYGLTDRGVVRPGKRADLLLIGGDPIANISTTRTILRVWNAGIEYQPVASAS